MPEREEDHLTPATRLMEKRREMAEVESSLLAEKEVKKREEIFLNNSHHIEYLNLDRNFK
jgi:hypothetical protein